MSKLYFKKIEKCNECPHNKESEISSNLNYCSLMVISLGFIKKTDIEIPDWCPLVDYTERIEANETERVWLKIKGK